MRRNGGGVSQPTGGWDSSTKREKGGRESSGQIDAISCKNKISANSFVCGTLRGLAGWPVAVSGMGILNCEEWANNVWKYEQNNNEKPTHIVTTGAQIASLAIKIIYAQWIKSSEEISKSQ